MLWKKFENHKDFFEVKKSLRKTKKPFIIKKLK